MKVNQSYRAAGFTLVEMLAVVTIIVILAGLVIGGMGFAQDRQARDTAKVQIALLEKALEEYKFHNGDYPRFADQASGEDRTHELFEALYWDTNGDGLKGEQDPKQQIYLAELDPQSKQGWVEQEGEKFRIVDPWGNEYRYRSGTDSSGATNPSTQNPDFDIWSVGKDGRTNTSQPYDPEHDQNRDDIRNF